MNDDQAIGTSSVSDTSQLEHSAEVAAAFLDGGKAATDRLSAALGAEGVRGNAARMAAALNLAIQSPSMSPPDIAAFVVAHIGAPAAVESAADRYSARRAAAAESEERWTQERQEMARERNSAAHATSAVEDPAPDGPDAA